MRHVHPITPLQTSVALGIGTIAMLMPGVQPILLGELVAQKRISLEGVGLVAKGEIIALGIGVLLANALLPLSRMRLITIVACLLTVLFDLASTRLDGDIAFTLVRTLAGLSEGALVWVTTSVIVRAALPDRLAAIFLVVQTLAQAAVAAVLASVVMPLGGWSAGFATLAALTLLLLALVPLQRPRLSALVSATTDLPIASLAGLLALLPAFAQMAAIGALWAYLDPLGRDAGLDARAVQMLIAVMLLMQVGGGLLASALVSRLRTTPALSLMLLLQTAITVGIRLHPAPSGFMALCAGFAFVWLFSMPFHVRLALHADPAGRLAALVPGVQLLGVACGPLLTSLFVAGDDAHPVPAVSAAFALSAIVILLLAHRRAASLP